MSGDDVDHPVGNSGLGNQLAKFKNRRRAAFRPFQHNRIAGGQRRANLYSCQEQLRIPGDDGSNHAQRFPIGEDKHVRFVDRQGAAFNLVSCPRIEMEIFGNIGGLPACFLEHLTGITRFHPPQLFRCIRKKITKTAQAFTAFCRRHLRPGAGAAGGNGGGNGAVHILFCRLGHGGPHDTAGRINGVIALAITGIYPLSVDQHLIGRDFCHQPALPLISNAVCSLSCIIRHIGIMNFHGIFNRITR